MACTALLVEDDDDIRDSVRDELAELGCEVVACETALVALARLAEGLRPDFVLLDLLLPEMTGTEMLRKMKGEPALEHIPVVLMTASRVSGVVRQEGESQRVLHKPLRRWQLEQIVDWFSASARSAPMSGS